MEAIVTIVGFLGAGKTTLLKHLVNHFIEKDYEPFVVLNDYENAYLDAKQFEKQITPKFLKPLSGSCLCCSGINELRETINRIPKRERGITLIEANGTTDACNLMSFLGVGLNDWFLPPIQIAVVDVKNWQKRGEHNELEANQIQVSSIIVLTHIENLSKKEISSVIQDLKNHNSVADILVMNELDVLVIPKISPSANKIKSMDHHKAHWSSCSVDLPRLESENSIITICNNLPKGILRIKGCTQIGDKESYTYFERTPNGEISIKPYNGIPTTGSKLLSIGPGSETKLLTDAIQEAIEPR